jgi:Protein of unknown function (DUF998)
MPRWVFLSALAAPIVLLSSATLAAAAGAPTYSAVNQTMSVLAGTGRAKWIMTTGFVVSASCLIVTAAGLRILRPVPRAALATAGLCGLTVAAAPVSTNQATGAHLAATAVGVTVLAIWPALTTCDGPVAPSVCRTPWALSATAVMCGLLAGMYYQTRNGLYLGLAERAVLCTEMLWPFVVVVTARMSAPLTAQCITNHHDTSTSTTTPTSITSSQPAG